MSITTETLPVQLLAGRDLKAESQHYVHRVTNTIRAVSALGPLDTPEKADQAAALWKDFYDIIAFTTVDKELESAIVEDPAIIKILPDIWRILGEVEVAQEITWADRVAAAESKEAARTMFDTTHLHEFYAHVVRAEWNALVSTLGRVPSSVAIVGSGAMPETGIWIKDWANANGHHVEIFNLELFTDRLEKGKNLFDILCGSDGCTFVAGDVRTTPEDLTKHDVVYFNAAVGSTTLEKERIMLDVIRRMKPGALMMTRSTHGIKTMAYPPANIQTPTIMERLRPVQTCHLNGEHGKMANSSFIISRVV